MPDSGGAEDSGCFAMSRLLFGAAAIVRIGWRAVGIPTAFLLQITDEVVQVGLVEGVFVGSHARPAIADLVLDAVFVGPTPREQSGSLEDALEGRCALGELIMAEPAFVIENFPSPIRPAVSGFLELIDRFGALIGIALDGRRR